MCDRANAVTASSPRGARRAELSPERARYLSRLRRQSVAIWTARLGLLVVSLLLWEVAARRGWANSFLTSSPSQVAATLHQMARDGSLLLHTRLTAVETVAGFTAGTALGTLIAAALWWSEYLSRVLEPYLVVLNAMPKEALGPIFIVWLGNGLPAIVAMALAISVVVTVIMVFHGFSTVDEDKIKLLRTFGATRWQVLQKVVLPATFPTILAALKVNVGLALVGTIVGEFLVAQAGLGFLIIYGGQVFRMHLIISALTVLCLLSAVLYGLVSLLERALVRWRQ